MARAGRIDEHLLSRRRLLATALATGEGIVV